MSDSKNVTTGKPKVGGSIFAAPIGTALPTDTSTELNEAFKDLGYISEDGVTNSNSPTSDSVKAWGGNIVLNTSTEKPDTFAFTLIEATNEDALKVVYGDKNVTGTIEAGMTIKANADEAEEREFVFDMILKGGTAKRIVIPRGKVIEIGDISYVDDEPVGYALTVSATPDALGNTHYEYIKAKGE